LRKVRSIDGFVAAALVAALLFCAVAFLPVASAGAEKLLVICRDPGGWRTDLDGHQRSFNPKSAQEVIDGVVKLIVKELKQQGLV